VAQVLAPVAQLRGPFRLIGAVAEPSQAGDEVALRIGLGLEPLSDGLWRVHYGWIPLGLLDPRRGVERGWRQFGRLMPLPDSAEHQRHRRLYRR
jgi:hypothetical protein